MLGKVAAKKTAALLCAACMLAPAPSALAWEEVCLDFVLWKVWFSGKFKVFYGFQELPPAVDEGVHHVTHRNEQHNYRISRFDHLRGEGHVWGAKRYKTVSSPRYKWYVKKPQYEAHGSTWWSPTLRANNKHCSSIRHVPNSMKLAIYVDIDAAGGVWCHTKWKHAAREEDRYVYAQTNRPYRRLWYRVTGTTLRPNCYFNSEE